MIFSEDPMESPMNLSPHTVGGGVVSKRKRVSDACEIVKTELEEVRPKAKKQKYNVMKKKLLMKLLSGVEKEAIIL